MDMDTPDSAAAVPTAEVASTPGLRRRLVGAGLIGLAGAALAPAFAARAGASPEQATTTTAPPKRPSDADLELLRFAQTAELAAVALYRTALGGELGDTTRAVLTHLHDAHLAYGQSLAAEIGRTAPGAPDAAIVEANTEAFSGSQSSVVAAALALENVLVATHTELVATLEGIDGTRLIASIVVAESRHAAVLADLGGATELDALLLNDATALVPAEG